MKQKFVLFILSLFMAIPMSARWKYTCVLEGTNSATYEDSLVKVSFDVHLYANVSALSIYAGTATGGDYVSAMVVNKTSERIYVELGNAKVGYSSGALRNSEGKEIAFDETKVVSAGKLEFIRLYPHYGYIYDNKDKKKLKKGGSETLPITLPITYKGKHYDYEFRLVITAQKE